MSSVTFPAYEVAVPVKPAAKTADGGRTVFFTHGLAGGVLPVPALLTDVVAPGSQILFCVGAEQR